jgi:hypothetical protein
MTKNLIVPKYTVIFTYDLSPEQEEAYYRFALGEFVPGMQGLGLYLVRAWHTVYGSYPLRQSEFVAEDLKTVQDALDSEAFRDLESRLMGYVTNYNHKILHFSDGFQF